MISKVQAHLNQNPFLFYCISLLVAFGVWISLFWETSLFTSGFRYFINDHLMIAMHHELEQTGIFATMSSWIARDHNIGRFQPFYYIQAIAITQIFGINPIFWFSYACFLAALSSFFLFLFARLYGMSSLVATIFTGIVLIGPQAATWAQPSHPQVIGMTLLSASLLLAALSSKSTQHRTALDVCFFILTLLASLSKESFIIFIPALLAIKIYLYAEYKKVSLYQSIIHNRIVIGLSLLLMGGELTYIVSSIGTTKMGYAGLDEKSFDISKIFTTANTLIKASQPETLIISATFLAGIIIWKREPALISLRSLCLTALISLLIVIPQILLYTKSGIGNIYLIPATVGSALLLGWVLTLLQSHAKFLGYLLSGLALLIVLSSLSSVLKDYRQMATDSQYMNGLLQQTQVCTPDDKPILVVVNPRLRYEAILAVKVALNYIYDRNRLILATYGLEKTDFFSDRHRKDEARWAFLDPQAPLAWYDNVKITSFKEKDKIAAVIVFDRLDKDFLKTSTDWFNPQAYRTANFPVSFAPARLYCKQ